MDFSPDPTCHSFYLYPGGGISNERAILDEALRKVCALIQFF